jgi:hypothetical protein
MSLACSGAACMRLSASRPNSSRATTRHAARALALLLLLFQGAALVSRAQPDRDGLATAIDAAHDNGEYSLSYRL